MNKEDIRKIGLSHGADVVGFAAVEDYQSKRSPNPKTILPGIRSMVVLGFRELDGGLADGDFFLSEEHPGIGGSEGDGPEGLHKSFPH